MLNAHEVNAILDALLVTLEERAPAVHPLAVEPPQGVTMSGTHGSVILGALITGSLRGKITFIVDWGAAFTIAEGVTGQKVESFDEAAQRALEGIFYEAATAMAANLAARKISVEIFPLPTLIDTSVLLGEDAHHRTIRVPIVSKAAGNLNLYLSFTGLPVTKAA